jgi:hypothetical protein
MSGYSPRTDLRPIHAVEQENNSENRGRNAKPNLLEFPGLDSVGGLSGFNYSRIGGTSGDIL